MSGYEVPEPIINSPYDEPAHHWNIIEGETPRLLPGRRPSIYFFVDQKAKADQYESRRVGTHIELKLVNLIRRRVAAWRAEGYPGVTRTTLELLKWWQRDGRNQRLFFAQLEAAETIIFLPEARQDFRQGLNIPRDEPSAERKDEGYAGFLRYANKMATGTGKTTVMGMLAAWSILNKVNDRSDARFSDAVLIVCPNVTIRERLSELDPNNGEASLYVTRDLVPPYLLPALRQGKVLVTNWHAFEPRATQVGGVNAKVNRAGREVTLTRAIVIGPKNTTARGTRYLTLEDFNKQVAAGLLRVVSQETDRQGNLTRAKVEYTETVETDTGLVNRVMGKEFRGKQNILIMNDEAHHAYRLRRNEPDEAETDLFGEEDEAEEFFREATVWMEGLDRINKVRGINFCLDLSATPYFLGRMGPASNRIFPWVVSDFSLVDAIESGLVKIPQLAVRDTTGASVAGYFNIWQWILPQLTPAERGGKKASPKPEAILKYADYPIRMLAGLWEEACAEWAKNSHDPRPPVFIIVCKNTQISKVLYEWLAENNPPPGISPIKIEGFRNNGKQHTIRVDSKIDDLPWMRFTLNTVGKPQWNSDQMGKPLYPQGFLELAEKLGKPLHPPGRDVRCIVSVGMLTEGWDCLDSETEILTPLGWRGKGQIAPGDAVYSLNRSTYKMEIVPVLEYGERKVKADERMVRIKSQHLDIRTTEGHQFHIRYRNPRTGGTLSKSMLTMTGAELAARKSAFALPLAAEMSEPFPGLPLTNDEIRLLAWFMTDGGFSNYRLVITQAKKYHVEIRALLQRLELDYAEYSRMPAKGAWANTKLLYIFSIPKGTHSGKLSRKGWNIYCDCLDKRVAPKLHLMTREQFWLFWQELLKGDGERSGENHSGWLWCNLKEQADAYMKMALIRGFAASCHKETTAYGKTVYRVSVRNTQWINSDPNDCRAAKLSLEMPIPDEKVWCIRNQNSTIVTRRNGKVAILGNCNTVTHIIGLRPFMSQLLCEQVVGRGLRRVSYDLNSDGKLTEEVAKVFGVPFEVIPFKTNSSGVAPQQVKRSHIHSLPSRAKYEIQFPRVEGYTQAIRNRISVDWEILPPLLLRPDVIPPEVQMKSGVPNNQGRPSLTGPGQLENVNLNPFRSSRRLQELSFAVARTLTKDLLGQKRCELPAHVLFPQVLKIVDRYLYEKVEAQPPAEKLDLFLAPYYGWLVERLFEAIRPDTSQGESQEVPRYETHRGHGSTTDVNFWTSRDVREVEKSHVNFVVADTEKWEQAAAYYIDRHPYVTAFVKNAGLGFAIPYFHNGQVHDYMPDFIIKLATPTPSFLILETKGYDPLTEIKSAAAQRWVTAVNADGKCGQWVYAITKRIPMIGDIINRAAEME